MTESKILSDCEVYSAASYSFRQSEKNKQIAFKREPKKAIISWFFRCKRAASRVCFSAQCNFQILFLIKLERLGCLHHPSAVQCVEKGQKVPKTEFLLFFYFVFHFRTKLWYSPEISVWICWLDQFRKDFVIWEAWNNCMYWYFCVFQFPFSSAGFRKWFHSKIFFVRVFE